MGESQPSCWLLLVSLLLSMCIFMLFMSDFFATTQCADTALATTTGAATKKSLAVLQNQLDTTPTPELGTSSMKQAQHSHVTSFDRYSIPYATALYSSRAEPLNILSFGCSTGMEAHTLATKYFPTSTLHGYDIDDETLSTARGRNKNMSLRMHFHNGKRVRLDEHGPYDVIFANSVLCAHPPPKHHAHEFPFSLFQGLVTDLYQVLKVGGVFVVVNTNYLVTDTNIGQFLEPLLCECKNFVPLMASNGTYLNRKSDEPCVFRKR